MVLRVSRQMLTLFTVLFVSPFSFVVMIWRLSLKHLINRWFQMPWRSFDIAVMYISSWFVLLLQTKLVWEVSHFPKSLQMLPISTKPNCKMKWLRQNYLARDLHSMSVFKMLAHYILLDSALLCDSLHFHAHVLSPQTCTRFNCLSMKTRARWGV